MVAELADRRVLRRIDAGLDDTAPARRPITLADLLTFRLGFGAVFGPARRTRSRWPRRSWSSRPWDPPGPRPAIHRTSGSNGSHACR